MITYQSQSPSPNVKGVPTPLGDRRKRQFESAPFNTLGPAFKPGVRRQPESICLIRRTVVDVAVQVQAAKRADWIFAHESLQLWVIEPHAGRVQPGRVVLTPGKLKRIRA